MDAIDVAFVLFPNVTQLDLTGPVQVLSRLGNASVHLVAGSTAPVMTDAGFSINPPHSDIALCAHADRSLSEYHRRITVFT